jgi:hypothetical protein
MEHDAGIDLSLQQGSVCAVEAAGGPGRGQGCQRA